MLNPNKARRTFLASVPMRPHRTPADTEHFSRLLGVLSTRFARIPHDEIDGEINHWLGRIGRCLNLDRSVIGEYLPEAGDFRAVYHWTREGFPAAPLILASTVIPWVIKKVRAGEIVAVSGIGDLPPEAERERQFLSSEIGPKAVVHIPLVAGNRVIAGMTFADLHGERRWPASLVMRLKLVADILANALERKRAVIEANRIRDEAQNVGRLALMGEMAAAIAHELSHPLGAILANAQAARRMLESKHPDLDQLKETLDDVITAERRAAAYVSEVRSLFRRSELHTEALQVQTVLEAVEVLTRSDLQNRQISLQMRIEPALPAINADRVGIEQVMVNLIQNAADAVSDNGNCERTVDVRAFRQDPKWISIEVRDTGKGIDQKNLSRIFQPLFTTKDKGTGMGLAIVRSIVEAHGGHVRVQSERGAGAKFEFALPVAVKN